MLLLACQTFTICIFLKSVIGSFPVVTEQCPDPTKRNPYSRSLAFNKRLGSTVYPLHENSSTIATRFKAMIASDKLGWSRKVPIFEVTSDSTWDVYEVWYKSYDNWNSVWMYNGEAVKFRVPPASLIQDDIGKSKGDSSQDWPFLIFDPQYRMDPDDPSSTSRPYTVLRGFHTYIDHTAKIFYCEGCGLFHYNNDGTMYDSAESMGVDYVGQGTGCGLSWPGVVRKEDVQSGVIAHAIRSTYSTCDFPPNNLDKWLAPAVKTDQPKGTSTQVAPNQLVVMGQRFRLSPDTNCDNRLAPLYENNGVWYPPTAQHTAFTRMFCRAVRDYGFILSDGSGGCGGLSLQGESDVTADWTTLFGSEWDESTESWSYLIRDATTPDDNRYRDERHGVPWDNIQVLASSDIGTENACCGTSPTCNTTPAPTSAPYVDTTPGPVCLNENCCFKHRTITYVIRIADDNCVIYNNTFGDFTRNPSDMIKVYRKKDGTWAQNTLIQLNTFTVGADQDAIHVERANNVRILDNTFRGTLSSGYKWITLNYSSAITITNNVFGATAGQNAMHMYGAATSDNIDIVIESNTFTGMHHGLRLYFAEDLVIRDNTFTSLTGSGMYFDYAIINGLTIESNTFTDCERALYAGGDGGVLSGALSIKDNTVTTMSDVAFGFWGTTDGVILEGNTVSDTTSHCFVSQLGNNNNMVIRGNTLYDCGNRGLRFESGGTLDGSSILTIENNMIYGTGDDSIYFNSAKQYKAIIRFNTLIETTGRRNLYFPGASSMPSQDVYCNILIATSGTWLDGTTSNANDVLNYKSDDWTSIGFVDTNLPLSNVDVHVLPTSPVVEYCNGLNTALYPLPSADIDAHIFTAKIEAGADQLDRGATTSPTVGTTNPSKYPTANPTTNPTNNPTTPVPSTSPIQPTANPSKYPSKPPTNNPTQVPTKSTSNPSSNPTSSPVDAGAEPPCPNTNCCYKSIAITSAIEIAEDNCVVWDCTLSGISTSDMIKIVATSDNTVIKANTFILNPSQNQDAIHIAYGSNVQVLANEFSGTLASSFEFIYFEQSDTVTISGNTFGASANRVVIEIGSDSSSTTDNQDITIDSNSFTGVKYGVRVYYASNLVITGNTFSSLSETAIYLWAADIAGFTVTSNTITSCRRGLYHGGSGTLSGTVTISHNTITTMTEFGIDLAGTSDGTILEGNIISDCESNGITSTLGTNKNMIIKRNTISDCGNDALRFGAGGTSTGSEVVTIESNIIYKSGDNIYFNNAVTNKAIIRFNTLVKSGNTNGGRNIYLSGSEYMNRADVYCNILVATSSSYHIQGSPLIKNTPNNYLKLYSAIADVGFVNGDLSSLSTVDLHLTSSSPAAEYCNGLSTSSYPLPSQDIDGNTVLTTTIDAGADQLVRGDSPSGSPTKNPSANPIPATTDPTKYPTNNPSNNPSANPISPTENPSKYPTANPSTSTANPSKYPTNNPVSSGGSSPSCTNSNCCYVSQTITTQIVIEQDNCVVYDCTLSGITTSDMIKIDKKSDDTWPDNISIEDNTITLNPSKNQDAIHLEYGSNVNILGNTFSGTLSSGYEWVNIQHSDTVSIKDNTFSASASRTAIYIDGSVNTDNKDITIETNTFSGLKYGIKQDHAHNLVVTGNDFTDLSDTAVYLRDVSGTVSINSNTMAVIGDNAIEFAGTTDGAIIEDNTISGVEDFAIYASDLSANKNMIIRRNTISDCGDDAIRLNNDDSSLDGTEVLTIESNVIYKTGEGDNIYFSSAKSNKVIIRFNTLITENRNMYFYNPTMSSIDVYCNILVTVTGSTSSYIAGTTTNVNDVLNYKKGYADIDDVGFVNSDFSSLSTVNLHVQATSPVVDYCNALTHAYPLAVKDIDGVALSSSNIDAGADQLDASDRGSLTGSGSGGSEKGSTISAGAYIGIGVGCCFVLVLCGVGFYYCVHVKERRTPKAIPTEMDKVIDVGTPMETGVPQKEEAFTPMTPLREGDAVKTQNISAQRQSLIEIAEDGDDNGDGKRASAFGSAVQALNEDN